MKPTWFTLGELVTDRPDWEDGRARLEAAVRRAVAEAGLSYTGAIFSPWSTRADGVIVYHYLTTSREVWERFQASEA